MAVWWRAGLGAGRAPSADQEAGITAPATGRRSVNAGAGTGKTSTLALRALYLIEAGALRADQIVVITFTNKAATEVGARIADTLDRATAAGAPFVRDGSEVQCATIHALATTVLIENALAFGLTTAPRPIGDGEAYRIFHAAFRALLDGDPAVDMDAFPLAESNLAILERDLGKLALRLKNHGITPDVFAARALAHADGLRDQHWGQLWAPGTGRLAAKPKELMPKTPVTPLDRAREAQRERANIGVVHALLTAFDRRLAATGALTYGDLIGRTTALLAAHPTVVMRLRRRWRYVLLDESQDTSDQQLAFIETLFGRPGDPDAAGMMPVGDTRQAIYGFNGADERVMERLAAAADTTHPLVVNRRSAQEIVDAGDAVLRAAGIVDDAVPRLQATAGSAGLQCVRVQTFGIDGQTVKEHVEAEAAAIARETQQLLTDPAIAPSDVAILVRRRTHAAAYVRALNIRGIAAALDRRSGLFSADEIRDTLAWIALLVDLRDERAAVRILQSPLCGLNDAAMIALAGDDDWLARVLQTGAPATCDTDTRARVEMVRALLVRLLPGVALPLPVAIANVLGVLPIVASYAALGAAVGAQAIANLRGFEELACAFAAQQPGVRLRDFLDDVNRRIMYDDEPQEAELDREGVRVLTIHQSKGLEWPYVFVACATSAQYGNTEPTDRVVGYDMESGAFGLKHDVDGRETFRWLMLTTEHDPQTGEKLNPAPRRRATDREGARVFYVAVTRAKRRVYITAPAPSLSRAVGHLNAILDWAKSIEPGTALTFDHEPDSVSAADAAVLVDAPVRGVTLDISNVAMIDASMTADASASREEATPVTGRAPNGTQPPAFVTERISLAAVPSAPIVAPRISFSALAAYQTCPRLARYRYRLMLPALRETQPRFVGIDAGAVGAESTESGSNAARLGSLAHRALEYWGRATIGGAPITADAAFDLAECEFTDATIDEAVRARDCARHAAAVLAPYTLLAAELAFTVAVGATRVEGVIDVVARNPSGRLTVIDYKTGRTADDHYRLQLGLYRHVAAERYPRDTEIDTAILRISPAGATFALVAPMPRHELDAAVAAVGSFASDVATVGSWCEWCAYRDSPCTAPYAASASDNAARKSTWTAPAMPR